MDKRQQILIKLLSAAIRGQQQIVLQCEELDWNELYNEAMAHEVHTLIYPIAQSLSSQFEIRSDLMAEWNKLVLLSGMHQVQHIQQMSEVIAAFNKSNIPVIALKGLVLRDIYPNPDLRTMSDADILVHKEDITRATNLLFILGYHISSSDNKHIHFDHESYLPIELHQSIISYERFNHIAALEDTLWENAVKKNIGSTPVLSFCPEDQLLHLCLHMASHIKSTGFGLRQLCDMVVWVEWNRELIDWDSFVEKSKTCEIDILAQALFAIGNRLFEMPIPDPLYHESLEDEPYINMLIEDILSAGVYGRKTTGRVISNLQMHFSGNEDAKTQKDRILNTLSLIFPSPKKLGQRYSYAKKHRILIPVAWGHRMVWSVIRKDLNTNDKMDYIFTTEGTKAIREERSKLLHWLQLR